MLRLKNYIGVARLPSEYQEVEYIESTGTQWINTDYIPSINVEVEIQYMVLTRKLYGPHILSTNNFFTPFFRQDGVLAHNHGGEVLISVPYNSNTIYTIKAYPNDTTIINGTTYSVPKGSKVSTVPFYMFTYGGAPTNTDFKGKVRVYYCKIYDNGTLVRDYIPCYRKSDNVAGLYDLANDKFYLNAGAGVFLVGADTVTSKKDLNYVQKIGGRKVIGEYVGDKLIYENKEYTQVEYIESTGTQYIDTDVIPNKNTKVEITLLDSNTSNYENYFGSDNTFRFQRNTSQNSYIWLVNGKVNTFTNANIYNTKKTLIFDNTGIHDGTTSIYSITASTFSLKYNILIFQGRAGAGNLDVCGSYKLYAFKIYDGNTLVRNFKPVIRNADNVAGLLDKVNGIFYPNAGTGTFLVGPVVE